jgi:hypothetical protein
VALLTTIGATALAAAAFATPAGAEAFGQIGEAWGKAGSADGQFRLPGMLGVDSSDGSVYTGDEKDSSTYRIQKFTASGEFKAKAEVPRFEKVGLSERLLTLHGIAVDPALHRIYMVEGCHLAKPSTGICKEFGTSFGAKRILVFSTEPSGTTLVPAPTATLPLPEGEETLYEPQSIAVDPSNHDIVILAENTESHTTVQRISSTGVAGARFVDTANALRAGGKVATAIAVGPSGTTYTLTGSPSVPGAANTRAWQFPKDLSGVAMVPGFAAAAESEGWTTGLLSPKTPSKIGGPQLAISPDGSTLYWKESIEQAEEETEPGNVLVRGFSLTEDATKVLYGNGSNVKKRCKIETAEAGIGVTGEKLVVFDYGPKDESPPFGDRVMTFGAGGSDCRVPAATFTVNGESNEEVTVEKGVAATFDAKGSEPELFKGSPVELDWDFGDGSSEEKIKGTPAAFTVKHTFSSAGTYRVTLRMKLKEAEGAATVNPLPVTRLVKVGTGGLPKLTVAKTGSGFGAIVSSPAGINCGSDCDQEYESGKIVTLTATAEAGSKFTGWAGSCAGTGVCEVTMSAAKEVKANFDPAAMRKLTVIKTGGGAVTSVPSGIDCRGDCEQEYEEGAEVTLTPHTIKGSEIEGWTVVGSPGSCPGTGTCKVTMSAAKEVKAKFSGSTPEFMLTVNKLGAGSGTVGSEQGGFTCTGSVCERKFKENEVVKLVQAADGGSFFLKWGKDCSGSGTCEVTMTGNKEVDVYFEPNPTKFPLEIIKTGTGVGKVTSTPAGIDCEPTCEHEFPEGLEVELNAKAETGSKFVKWGGACSGSGTCEVTMSEAKSVIAQFEVSAPPAKFMLKVKKTGPGKVTSTPAGIDCGSTCEFEFEKGKVVTLTQTADPGSEFVKWGGACAGAGVCEVTMSAAKEVTAEFKTIGVTEFTLKVKNTGLGKVTSTPAGIDCGSTCEHKYPSGEEVELKQTADPGSEFVKWGGACAGSGICKVTMSAAKEVTAEFKPTAKFRLTVTKAGTGSGKVTSNPAGIDCGSTCEFEFEKGKVVTLTPTADTGSEFKEWTGSCTGSGGCEVTLSSAKKVGATFKPNPVEKVIPPPPPPVGQAQPASSAQFIGGKAALKLTCAGGPCHGTLQLTAKIKLGKKLKNAVIGKASFGLADGASAMLKIKLSGPAKQELSKGKTLKAKVTGIGIASFTVKIKPAKKK